MKVVFAVTHAMTWFWTQTCLAALRRTLEEGAADGMETEIVVVDNSWDNSPTIHGLTETRLGEGVKIIENRAVSMCHSAALDIAFEASWPMDYFVPMDTDVVVTQTGWLRQFLDRLRPTDYAVGDWHHEEWLYPSFALYRGEAVKGMADASARNDDKFFRWGDGFNNAAPIPDGHGDMLKGPFSERRGWPPGTVLKQRPTGQLKGPGHYEPGQQFHHWALEAGYTYSVCPATTIRSDVRNIPLGTFYGVDAASGLGYNEARDACWAVHFWAGTRALDFINPRGGDLNDPAIVNNIDFWLEREAGWWLNVVPRDVQETTLGLIKKHGWSFVPLRPDAREDSLVRIKAWYGAGGIPLE